MRIEAQGKYLQTILEKAHKNLSYDASGATNLETTRSQLTDFNLALSGFMDDATQACGQNNGDLAKAISDDNLRTGNLGFPRPPPRRTPPSGAAAPTFTAQTTKPRLTPAANPKHSEN